MHESGERRSLAQRMPDAVWCPLVAGLLIAAAGAIGLAFRQPWLFPSLGPTAYMQVAAPKYRSSNFYCTLVGHLTGMLCGLFAVWITGSSSAPPVVADARLTPVRLLAAAIALALTILTGLLLHAVHPPAAATTLIFALGSLNPTVRGMTILLIGVVIIAVLGEAARLVRIGEKPSWNSLKPTEQAHSMRSGHADRLQ